MDVAEILAWGANFGPFVLEDQWWRVITSAFLHCNINALWGLLHICMNMLALLFVGRRVESSVGFFYFLILYLISAATAGLASAYWNLFAFSVGASGAIFGLFGFEFVLILTKNRNDAMGIWIALFNFFLFVAIIFIAGQFLPFDNAGHMGGLVAGIILGMTYRVLPEHSRPQTVKFAVAFLLLLITYFSLPRYQSKYFNVFQDFIATEDGFNNVFKAESDSAALERLRDIQPRIQDVYNTLDSFETDIPLELQLEINDLRKITKGVSEQTRFYINLIERESYIYHDSIEWALEEFRQTNPLRYNLRLDQVSNGEEEKPREEQNLVVVEQFYDKDWRECDITHAHYYRRGFKDSLGRWDGPVRDYYLDGGIQMKGEYKKDLRNGVFLYYSRDSLYESAGRYREEWKIGKWEHYSKGGQLQDEIRYRNKSYLINHWSDSLELQVDGGEGDIIDYHQNGIIANYEHYSEGRKDSISYGFYENGNVHFKEFFDDGRLLQGISYDLNGNKYQYDESTQLTYPETGMDNFWEYVSRERTDILGDSPIGYETELVFNISESGEIFDIRVMSGDADSLNVIAKVILRNGPKWIPAKEHGIKPVASESLVKITF